MVPRTMRLPHPHAPAALVLLLLSGTIPTGCSSEIPTGGFLSETSKLQKSDLTQEMYVHVDEAVTRYDRVTLAPLVVRFTPQKPLPVALRDPGANDAAYRGAVEDALGQGGRFKPANRAGRGVLTIRAAVTDRFQRDEKDPGPGPATLELEAVDSLSKKRVFAVLDPAFAKRDSGGEQTSAADAFARFARRLRMRLDEAAFDAPK